MRRNDPILLSCPVLLDVSRLVWRRWAGRLPTGIDRVCLAYLDRFGPRACAVLQWRGQMRVLSRDKSARLFGLLAADRGDFRMRFAAMLPALVLARGDPPVAGALYLNIGHTGLDHPALPRWIAARRLRAVFLLHDLIPITHPEFCRAGEGERHTRRIRHALQAGSGIIVNSAATLTELADFAARDGLRLPQVVAAWLSGPKNPAITAIPAPAPDRPWFITVGTIEGRKNHVLLLQAWQKLAHIMGAATPLLVIIGQRGWEAGLAHALIDRDAAIAPHVLELGRADDARMAGLIAGARALLMPSFAEGFGLPVIEALALGTPVIASNLPVFHEIAGTIPTFLDPTDGPGWLATIRDYCSDCPERLRQIVAIAGYRAPTWDDHFDAVETWLGQ